MIIRDIVKEIYYYKIKKMTTMEFRIFHLKRIGMNIGEDCWLFSDGLETAEPYLVTIGSHVMIAPDVKFTTHDASASFYIPGASDLFGRIEIGNEVFIGMGTIVLPGVVIPDHCIVGAGSVITKRFERPGMVIAGNPAKEICTVEQLRDKNQKYVLNIWGKNATEKRKYLLDNEDKFKGIQGKQ